MLYEDVQLYMEEKCNEKEMEIYTSINKDNVRIEKRICRKTGNTGWISNKNKREGLCSIFSVERRVMSENSLKSLNILRKFTLMAHKKYILSQPRKKAYKNSMFDCLLNDDKLLEVLKNL